jgi:hypothetical protein
VADALIPALVGALGGAIFAFLATRAVDRAAARRVVYSRCFGPAEMMAWDLLRRMTALQANTRPIPDMPSSVPLNEPMGEVAIVGSVAGLRAANAMIGTLNRMRAVVEDRQFARDNLAVWDELVAEYNVRRRAFLQLARREAAMWPLPDKFFEGK